MLTVNRLTGPKDQDRS